MTADEMKSQLTALDSLDRFLASKADEVQAARQKVVDLKRTFMELFPKTGNGWIVLPGASHAEKQEAPKANLAETPLPPSLQDATAVAVEAIRSQTSLGATCKQVTDFLKSRNFKTEAKDLYSSVSVTLKRLTERGVLRKDTGAGKAIYLPSVGPREEVNLFP
jgi:hypothetical protein